MLTGQDTELFKQLLTSNMNCTSIVGFLYLFYTDDFAHSDVQSGWDDVLLICGLFRVALLRSSFWEAMTI